MKTRIFKFISSIRIRTIFITITIISIGSASGNGSVYAISTTNVGDSLPVLPSPQEFAIKNEKLMKFNKNKLEFEEANFVEAKLSNQQDLVAFTEPNENGWGTKPDVYIYSLKKKSLEKIIPMEDDHFEKFAFSWSRDDNYLLLVNKAQSVGLVRGYVVDIKKSKVTKVLEMYDHKSIWLDDSTLIYIRAYDTFGVVHRLDLLHEKNSADLFDLSLLDIKRVIIKNLALNQDGLNLDYATYSSYVDNQIVRWTGNAKTVIIKL